MARRLETLTWKIEAGCESSCVLPAESRCRPPVSPRSSPKWDQCLHQGSHLWPRSPQILRTTENKRYAQYTKGAPRLSPAKWKTCASPEGRSKAKCLERNESDEHSNVLKRLPAKKYPDRWCLFIEPRRVLDVPHRKWKARKLLPALPSHPSAISSCSQFGLTRQRPREEVETPV